MILYCNIVLGKPTAIIKKKERKGRRKEGTKEGRKEGRER